MGSVSYGLEGKVVLVTGGSRGIGLEIAGQFLKEKAKVVICARKKEGLEGAVTLLGGGENLLAVPAHVAKEEDVEKLFDAVLRQYGTLDILINNMGMNLLTPSLVDTEPATWNKILESNLTGTFLCSRKAAKIMKDRKAGKIVSVSSVAGSRAAPGMGVYGIAKAGIEMLTKVLAAELAPFNIQVNAVAPGMVRTDFSKPFWSNEAFYEQMVKAIPAGRIAEPVDVVHPVLFLCSNLSGFITGQTIMVDGGASAV
jgi:NAD(P)-dependent dehydrogenase (short-subunit alcohol dehydrogenase family)